MQCDILKIYSRKISKNVLETILPTKYQYTYFWFVSRLSLKEMPLHKVYTEKQTQRHRNVFL